MIRVDFDAAFPMAALVTKQACEELGLSPGVPVTAVLKAANVHLIPR
jgi:molybdate transport system ATP-binding protein